MADSIVTSGRPRRSTRAPIKAPLTVTEASQPSGSHVPGRPKAQAPERTLADKLEYLLTNSKSKLTRIDISDVLSYANFLDLSAESQSLLVSLLPPTAFAAFSPSVPPTHIDWRPSRESNAPHDDNVEGRVAASCMDVDVLPSLNDSSEPTWPRPDVLEQERTPATLDPTVFTSPHLLSAARTYQDHLFSGWFSKKAREEVTQFREGVRRGTLHVEWKDDVWERDHSPTGARVQRVDLTDLVKRGLLQQGDVLSYRRYFPHAQVTVVKDVLVDSVNARVSTLVVLLPRQSAHAMPPYLLVAQHPDPQPEDRLQLMDDLADPAVLERAILDMDGRVARSGVADEPRLAWKAFTVWRWREEMREAVEMQMLQERGGRERIGSLFYLSTYCHGQK